MDNDMNAPNEWQCSHCKKIYSFKEFMKLQMEFVNPEQPEKFGKRCICECGKPFHKDKWSLVEIFKTFPHWSTCLLYPKLRLSTVHLELNHFGHWYETMVFADNRRITIFSLEVYFQDRYKTQEEAIKGHEEILRKLKIGQYTLTKGEDGKRELRLQ